MWFDNEAYGNAFINSMVGEGAMRGYFSSMIQTGIGGAVNYGFEGEFKGLLNNRYADSQAFKSVVTNGLTAGAEFAMFGDTSINVLNTSMFGLPGSQGLLSLNLSNDGVRGSIGGGGLDMNLGNIWNAARVGSIFSQNNAMEKSGFDDDELVAGRVLWSDGIDQTSQLLDELMSGDAVLNRNTLTDGVAKTTLIDGIKQIDLSKITEGDLGLMLGVILSHEAMRDGIEGTQQEQAIETFRSVLTHSIVGQMVGNTYGMGSLDAGVIADIKALQSGDMDAFARYALGKFDGSADFWKLVTDEDGNSSLEYDGNADIFDEDGNFLIGAGTSPFAIQTALSKYLGVSMGEAFDSMNAAGMTADGNTWGGNALEGNMGKRIAIGGANDINTTDYIFAAHNIGEIRSEIEQQYDISGSVDGARETLLANGWNIGLNNQGSIAGRYMNLRDQAINFYLPNSGMFENGFGTDITQFSENYNLNGNNDNHKGIDIAGNEFGPTIAGQQFNSIFSGNVAWTALNSSIFYNDEASWKTAHDPNSETLDNLLYHDGDGKVWKDSRYGGNTVAINQGFNFNSSFMDMGFNTRSNHFESIIANSGYVNAGSGIGKAGNTGSSTGPHVDWNVYINDPYGTGNFFGSLYNLDFNQAYTNTTGERYYDPEKLYDLYY